MTINVGINGFGRIGRLVLRNILSKLSSSSSSDINIIAINNPSTDTEYISYLFKYDSTHGKFNGDVKFDENYLIINNSIKIKITRELNPINIPWKELGVDYVIESTGIFKELNSGVENHLISGAKKVIITSPSKTIPMFVIGVNEFNYNSNLNNIISNASCTTNCIAPLIKILNDNFGILDALITTIHSVTASQKLIDGTSSSSSKKTDWRNGRSAIGNIIPSSTGAAKAVSSIIPELENKITGISLRVPTINISIVDLTIRTSKSTSYQEIKSIIYQHSNLKNFENFLGYTDEFVVSSDFISNSKSCIFDSKAGIELNSNFFKLLAWYDNEYAYSARVVDLLQHIANVDENSSLIN